MWLQNSRIYCRQHLLGYHYELHKLAGHLKRCRSLYGFVKNGLIETRKLVVEHELIVNELKRRKYQHHSPLRLDYFFRSLDIGRVNKAEALTELLGRCPDCRLRYELLRHGKQSDAVNHTPQHTIEN